MCIRDRAGGLAGGVFFLSAAFSPIQDFPSFTCKKIKHVRACVCVWVNDPTTERPELNQITEIDYYNTNNTNDTFALQVHSKHTQHPSHSRNTTRARTHARTACTYEKKTHTQRHRLNTQHTAVTPLLHIRLLYLCLPYSSSNDTQRSAAHRNDHHRSNQQQTTNQKKKYQRRG